MIDNSQSEKEADVAQLVERILGKNEVSGPIPGVGSIYWVPFKNGHLIRYRSKTVT